MTKITIGCDTLTINMNRNIWPLEQKQSLNWVSPFCSTITKGEKRSKTSIIHLWMNFLWTFYDWTKGNIKGNIWSLDEKQSLNWLPHFCSTITRGEKLTKTSSIHLWSKVTLLLSKLALANKIATKNCKVISPKSIEVISIFLLEMGSRAKFSVFKLKN